MGEKNRYSCNIKAVPTTHLNLYQLFEMGKVNLDYILGNAISFLSANKHVNRFIQLETGCSRNSIGRDQTDNEVSH